MKGCHLVDCYLHFLQDTAIVLRCDSQSLCNNLHVPVSSAVLCQGMDPSFVCFIFVVFHRHLLSKRSGESVRSSLQFSGKKSFIEARQSNCPKIFLK
jgi:hypothetical protein